MTPNALRHRFLQKTARWTHKETFKSGLNIIYQYTAVNRSKNRRWIDGNEINIKQFTGKALCEKLAAELWGNACDQWLDCADFLQNACFLIAFDTELTMEGIFTFLENSIGHYAPNIIQAFKAIGDNNDAEILEEICRLAPPDVMRGEFLSGDYQEYDITSFDDSHKLSGEVETKIAELSEQLYLHSGIEIWSLLFTYLDEQIKNF